MTRTAVPLSNARSVGRPVGLGRARRRSEVRRMEILRAAARIFRERGFAQTGMREIAVAADLSPANLYYYFKGKHEILFFCQSRSLDRLLQALDRARARAGAVVPRLRALAESHVQCLLDVEGSTTHFEVDALLPALRARIVAQRDRYEQGTRALVSEGVRRGELRDDEPAVMTRAFLGALNWTAQWFRPDGALSADQVAAAVADYAVAGLGGRPVRGRGAGSRRRPRDRRRT